jgi:hypothetical protein
MIHWNCQSRVYPKRRTAQLFSFFCSFLKKSHDLIIYASLINFDTPQGKMEFEKVIRRVLLDILHEFFFSHSTTRDCIVL